MSLRLGAEPARRIRRMLGACALGLFVAYLGGAFVLDFARVGAGLALLALLLQRGRDGEEPAPPRWQGWVLLSLCLALWVEVTGHLLFRIVLGEHGIDFAIFSQAISSIAREGVPWVSLVGEGPRNFLTHHFTPYLYLPGGLGRLGLSGPVSGVVVHAAGLFLAFFALYRALRTLGVGWVWAAGLLCVAAFSPAMRAAWAWTMNDEMYGAPFVVLGLWLWLSGRYRGAALAFFASCLCKESFFLVTGAFVFVACVWHTRFRPPEERRRALLAFVPLGVLAVLLFAGYFFLQPLLFGKGFDHADKLVRPEQLFAPAVLGRKLLYVGSLLAPTLGAPLFFARGRRLLVVAVPGVALSLVSGFDEMYRPLNYYAVTPLLVSFVALGACWPELVHRLGQARLSGALVLMAFGALSVKPLNLAATWGRAFRQEWRSSAQLAFLPEGARIVADPAAAALLSQRTGVLRLWGVARDESPPPFDVVVWKPGGYEEPTPELLARTRECGSSPLWQVRCPVSPAPAPAPAPGGG